MRKKKKLLITAVVVVAAVFIAWRMFSRIYLSAVFRRIRYQRELRLYQMTAIF